jgi:anti-sigma B factor antagonist
MISPRKPFSISSERTGLVHRITPVGELDLATVPKLREEFEAVFSDGDAEVIVVDLTKLDFIDSTGIHALLEMNAVCEHTERLRIVNGSPPVVRLIDIAGVRDHLPIITSADDPRAPLPTRTAQPPQ